MGWWNSLGIPVAKMVELTTRLDAVALAEEIAPAFLVSFSTMSLVRPGTTRPGVTGAAGDDTAGVLLRFLPVRRRSHSTNPFVGLGRLDGNDLSLADATVSKFHAFFVEQPSGTFAIVDAGSANGTFVERTRAPVRGEPPLPLRSGDSIRFGSATTTFLSAADALAFVKDNFTVDPR